MFQKQMAKVTNNPIGSIVGGVAGYYVAKKMANVSNMWAIAGITILGVVLGANAQSMMKAQSGTPTAQMTK